MKLRRVVQVFAETMERKLRANDWKGGWENDSAQSLLVRVVEEIAEVVPLLVASDEAKAIAKLLHHAAADIETAIPRQPVNSRRVRGEAVDVANMIMMVADVCEALAPGSTIGDGREQEATAE